MNVDKFDNTNPQTRIVFYKNNVHIKIVNYFACVRVPPRSSPY